MDSLMTNFLIRCRHTVLFVALLLGVTAWTGLGSASEAEKITRGRQPSAGWSASVQGGLLHQFDADLDDGGSFSVNRLFIQGGPGYTIDNGRQVSFSVGYGFDGYDFSGHHSLAAMEPWGDVHSLRFSIPLRWRVDSKWSAFVSPTLRFTAESGADFNDAVTGGGFAGVAYRVNDRLTIGPGIGILTQLEDSTQVIPVLIIDWKITDTLSLNTGRGVGATLGPGLALNWKPSSQWELTLGGRMESLRFRLDDEGEAPDGIGDDRAFPIYLGAVYRFTPLVQLSLFGGVEVGGELRLEDENGSKITEQDHDTAGFLGVTFSARF